MQQEAKAIRRARVHLTPTLQIRPWCSSPVHAYLTAPQRTALNGSPLSGNPADRQRVLAVPAALGLPATCAPQLRRLAGFRVQASYQASQVPITSQASLHVFSINKQCIMCDATRWLSLLIYRLAPHLDTHSACMSQMQASSAVSDAKHNADSICDSVVYMLPCNT